MFNNKDNIFTFTILAKKLKIFIFFTIVLSCFYKPLFALNPDKKLHHNVISSWNVEDGLPQNYIKTMIQTKDGYLWFGTEEGLSRFDGLSFKNFNKRTHKAFNSNNIKTLFEDSKRNLWIGTGNGLVIFSNGEFKRLSIFDKQSSTEVRAIAEDNNGIIWIGTIEGHIYKKEKEQFKKIHNFSSNFKNRIHVFYVDNKNDFWISTDKGLYKKSENEQIKPFVLKDNLIDIIVLSILEDEKNTLYFGTYGAGLIQSTNNKVTVFTEKDGLSNNKITSLIRDKDGNLWIGTYGGGLNRYHNKSFSNITSSDGLLNNMVLKVFEDFEGNIWVGTYKGLNRLKDGSLYTLTTHDGLAENDVNAVISDKNGNLWVGTWNSGLSVINKDKSINYTTKQGLSNNVIKTLYEEPNGNIWIGTYGGGLNLFKDNKFTNISNNKDLLDNNISTITKGKENSLWIGTFSSGLKLYENGNFKSYTTKDGLKSNMIRALYYDSEDNLWIGTKKGGLNLFKNSKFNVYDTSSGLSNNTVYSIYKDKEKNLWIGTEDGLTLFKNNKFTVFNTTHGLYDDIALTILEDKHGYLWMSCNRGIYKVKKQDFLNISKGKSNKVKSISYGVDDGMKSRECNGGFQPAGFKAKNGELYFPTIKGLVVSDPDYQLKNTKKPPVYIEALMANGKKVKTKKEILLKPEIDKLEFHYTALSYTSPKKVKFKYMLEGFDNEWINAESRRTAYYTNLPHGNYTFKVKACNNDGIWNETGAELKFEKLPFFHQTKTFYFLCWIFVMLLLFVIYKYRMKKIEKKHKQLGEFNKKLESEVKIKTLELKNQNVVLNNTNTKLQKTLDDLKNAQNKLISQARLALLGQMVSGVSHEIGNPLNAMTAGANNLNRFVKRNKELLNEINNESEELKELLDINELSERATSLIRIGNERIKNILNNLRVYLQGGKAPVEDLDVIKGMETSLAIFGKKIERQNIKVKTKFDDLPKVRCKAGELNQVFTNLIVNSIDAMPKGGTLELNGQVSEDKIIITIKDTGPGIPDDIKESVFEPFFTTKQAAKGTGLGLYISYEIITKLNGELKLKDSLEGAEFIISLPFSK